MFTPHVVDSAEPLAHAHACARYAFHFGVWNLESTTTTTFKRCVADSLRLSSVGFSRGVFPAAAIITR